MLTLSHFDASLFGDNITTHINIYTPKPRHACCYEIHKRFVDVQYMVNGQEYMDIVSPQGLTLRAPFNEEKDCGFFNEVVEPDCRVLLRPNLYCFYFPWEAHMPCIAVNDSPTEILKHVAKIPLENFMRVFKAGMLGE